MLSISSSGLARCLYTQYVFPGTFLKLQAVLWSRALSLASSSTFLACSCRNRTCSAMTVSLLPAVARVNWSAFWTWAASSTRSNWFFLPTLSALTSWKPRGASSRGTRLSVFWKFGAWGSNITSSAFSWPRSSIFAILSEGYFLDLSKQRFQKCHQVNTFFGTFTPLEDQLKIYNLLG